MDNYNQLIKQAKLATKQKNFDEAIMFYEEAFKTMIIVDDLLDLALLYLDNKMPLKAKMAFESIIDYFPNLPQGYYGLGLVYEQLSKIDLAEEAYQKVIKIDRTYAQAYFNIALLAEDVEDEQRDYDYYKKTLLYNPNHFWANLNLGSFYEKKEMYDLALEHTIKAYKQNPNEKMVTFNLGVIYSKLGDYEKAIKHYKEELKKENGYYMTYLNIALLYKDIYSNYEKSQYFLLEGISKYKDNVDLWYNLGCLYAIKEDYSNAINCFYYAAIKEPKIITTIEEDSELISFIKKGYYKELLEKIKQN